MTRADICLPDSIANTQQAKYSPPEFSASCTLTATAREKGPNFHVKVAESMP